jgi:hypothetical protein
MATEQQQTTVTCTTTMPKNAWYHEWMNEWMNEFHMKLTDNIYVHGFGSHSWGPYQIKHALSPKCIEFFDSMEQLPCYFPPRSQLGFGELKKTAIS